MVSLRHPNITTVMGIAEAAGEPPQLVMEYMEHGSLAALLQNETVPLEPDTKHNMAEGISRGMLYLHSQTPPVVHGSLSAGGDTLPPAAARMPSRLGGKLRQYFAFAPAVTSHFSFLPRRSPGLLELVLGLLLMLSYHSFRSPIFSVYNSVLSSK